MFSFNEGSALAKHLQPLDYISQLAVKPEITSQFPQAKDVTMLRSLGEVSCARFPANSVQVGPTDKMLGRVIHCCFGQRLYIAASVEALIESFADHFQQDFRLRHPRDATVRVHVCLFLCTLVLEPCQGAKSIGQLASWLHKLPFDRLEEMGFFVMLTAGATLLIPFGTIVVECCLGDVGATVLSYPTLLPDQFPGMQTRWEQVEKLLNPDNASQVTLGHAMSFVHRFILVASVKSEPEAEPDCNVQGGSEEAEDATKTRVQVFRMQMSGFVVVLFCL